MKLEAGQDFTIEFADKTGEQRSVTDLSTMIEEINEVANKYGYNIQGYGERWQMQKMMIDRQKFFTDNGIIIEDEE